jgi:hypothetical protein
MDAGLDSHVCCWVGCSTSVSRWTSFSLELITLMIQREFCLLYFDTTIQIWDDLKLYSTMFVQLFSCLQFFLSIISYPLFLQKKYFDQNNARTDEGHVPSSLHRSCYRHICIIWCQVNKFYFGIRQSIWVWHDFFPTSSFYKKTIHDIFPLHLISLICGKDATMIQFFS